MNTSIRYVGGSRFESLVRGHRIVTDQPVNSGGKDAGPTPPELLLASLGTCAGHYAAEYLRARGLSAEGLALQVFADTGAKPAHLSFFRVEVTIPDLSRKDREGLLKAVKSCLVHNTLRMSPVIDIDVRLAHAGEEVVIAG
jgi:putative redox protein